jgi:hypothetical protein
MSATITPRTKLIKQLRLLLGDQMIDVELDVDHFELAVDLSVERLRQRSDSSMQEKDIFIDIVPDQNVYKLPENIQTVWKVHRRGVGVSIGGSGVNFDPFEASFANYYMLQGAQTGGLATWEIFGEYKETLGRIFASQINFNWNPDNKELTIHKRAEGHETVMITAYAQKNEHDIITNVYSGPWIRDYALAKCKFMLGEARSLYTSGFAGPQGSIMLNGEQIKQEATQEMERLEAEIQNYITADSGMPFMIG